MTRLEQLIENMLEQQIDILRRLIRLESRLVRLAEELGVDVKKEHDHD